MTITEMLRLQGMAPHSLTFTSSDVEIGKQIGNAMSVNVVEQVKFNALQRVGTISKKTKERWDSGEGYRHVMIPVEHTGQALY